MRYLAAIFSPDSGIEVEITAEEYFPFIDIQLRSCRPGGGREDGGGAILQPPPSQVVLCVGSNKKLL